MLTLSTSNPSALTDRNRPSRRDALRVGALSFAGLSLADVTRLQAASQSGRRQKSVIMIFLNGGPPHLDMYDMKPDLPAEYRGEFQPIDTNVPGMQICELMPQQAKIADKFAVVRGVEFVHLHSGHEFYSGYGWQETPKVVRPRSKQRPALGSVLSRLRESAPVPPYVSLRNQEQWERAYYLGQEHEPFRVGGNSQPESRQNMKLQGGIDALRLTRRSGLRKEFDALRKRVEETTASRALDAFQQRALEVVTSGRVRDAFDVDKEPAEVRERYGQQSFAVRNQVCNKAEYYQAEHPGRSLLQARRLIEAGVSVVTFCMGAWDTHRYNFETLRQLLPPLDQAVSTLILDLEERGLLDDTIVMLGGEFGRAPRIGDVTPDGRGHWPSAGFIWMAGGGLNTGRIIGATDARGERSTGKPIRMERVLATLYHALGIDPALTFPDFNGRPQYIIEDREPIEGLL